MEKKYSSIIDIPRKANQEDLFGIDKYKTALVKFIESTNTPITIAIQGEWGSGKTSLMNSLKDELCDQDGKTFYPIWLNTWQYSLMKSEEQTLISVINGLTYEITDIAKEKNSNLKNAADNVMKTFGKVFSASAKVAIKATTGQDLDGVVDALAGGDQRDYTILKLRDALNELIKSVVDTTDKNGFIFFIDDLDRIDPPVAVNILELLKNIFDLDNCVFVLAIDYDVIVKGLEPKFGKLTSKNEREFRSFFDKIIQLPFSMPVTSYKVDTFLKSTLEKISYVPSNESESDSYFENVAIITNYSVGSNPRSLKRLVNTLSLIGIINHETGIDRDQNDIDKLINFALVCIQVAYPAIYKVINKEPEFNAWNEDTAQKLKLRKLEQHEVDRLNSSEEFDEEWERVLYRICEEDTYLQNRAFSISTLLNTMISLIPDDNEAELGEYIATLLELSSVTSVQAFDKPRAMNNREEAQGSVMKMIDTFSKKYFNEQVSSVKLPNGSLNRGQYLRFYDVNDKEVASCTFLITPKEGKLYFTLNRNAYLSKIGKNPEDYPAFLNIVKEAEYEFKEFSKKYNMTFSGLMNRIKPNRVGDHYVSSIRFKKMFKSEKEFYTEKEIDLTAKIIIELATIIHKYHKMCWDFWKNN